jgi:predicted DNA-binding protein
VIHHILEYAMATLNPRINITISRTAAEVLNRTAKQNKTSVSRIAGELIEWAIEEKEDIYFSKIADTVEQSRPGYVQDNDKIWS